MPQKLPRTLGIADVVVDLTSTGSTLRVNGLREVETVLRFERAPHHGRRGPTER